MTYQGKNISNVRRIRMSRMFIGTNALTTRTEHWIETGHFLQGVRFLLEEVLENDGDGHIAQPEYPCGFIASGEAVPSQNTFADYDFYRKHFRGKKSIAFLCGDQLWLFRSKYLGNKNVIDNRVSIVTEALGYDSPREQTHIKFQGWISDFELFKVKDFNFDGQKMTYQIVSKMNFTIPVLFTSGGAGGGGN